VGAERGADYFIKSGGGDWRLGGIGSERTDFGGVSRTCNNQIKEFCGLEKSITD